MEFRSCPSCKASVLEDDVADCPFCGASMSGKPGAKPAPKPGAGAAKPAPASAAKPAAPAAKGAPAAKAPASTAPARSRFDADPEPERPQDSGDPFEVDPLANKQATSVSVKAGKGRTIEVKCPMCETVGFIAPSQAGKDVKCCNPSCKLPIFKSPRLPPEVKVEVEKPKGMSIGMITVLALAVVALVGGGVYWFVLRDVPKPLGPINPGPVVPLAVTPDKPVENVVVEVQKRVVSTVEEIRTLSLEEIQKVTIQHDFRSKPFGKQLAIEALLSTGDLAGAKAQLTKWVGSNPQYAVEPLAILAQMQADAGDTAGAAASLNEAVKGSAKLPDVGRTPLDAVAILAAALVRFDRSPEAVELLGRYALKESGDRAALSVFWRSSLDRGTFHFAQESSLSHLELSGKPMWVSTAVSLCRQRQWDRALVWARAAPDQVTQDAALAACAGMLASKQMQKADPALESQLQTAIDAAGLAAKVRMRVAAAEVRFQAGDKSITAATVAEIAQLLASTPIPPAIEAPETKAIYDSKGIPFAGLPDPGPGTSLGLAYADVASLQMKLGDTAGGWATLGQAMETLRSVSPSPGMAQYLLSQCSENNGEGVKTQLDRALKLGGDGAKKTRAISQYRVQCEVILKMANDRFTIQQALLRRAMRSGLLKEVWQFMQAAEQMEMKQLEPYRSGSSLPNELYYLSVETGNQEFQKELFEVEYSDEERKGVRKTEATIGLLGALRSQARVGNFELAAEKLKPVYVGALLDRHILDRHVLEQVSGLAEKSIASSYAFTRKLFDQTIREDSLRLLAGRSIRLGKGPELWKLMDLDVNLKPTDKATAYLGFLEGIQATTGK